MYKSGALLEEEILKSLSIDLSIDLGIKNFLILYENTSFTIDNHLKHSYLLEHERSQVFIPFLTSINLW